MSLDPAKEVEPALEGGSYEVLRNRLLEACEGVEAKTQAINAQRMETFGGQGLTVLGQSRTRTEDNCIPRDMVALGDVVLIGYNVFLGLKTEVSIDQVFALHHAGSDEGESYPRRPNDILPNFLTDPRFVQDFSELQRFYSGARLSKVMVRNGRLLALFQTGQKLSDVRGFRWSLNAGHRLQYIDNRAEEDYQFPPSHDFTWIRCSREDQVRGRHPHVNILDTVFLQTLGGNLTLKVENNTEGGEGIYSEPVSDPRQSLDDAEFHYAQVGQLILLKILPYQESAWRYLVFNPRSRDVRRIDAVGQACLELPEDHGIIFPGGFYLQTGETKVFEHETADLKFERKVSSPNGEDVLYAFYHEESGRHLLLPYNLIRKSVETPIECHGFGLLADGRLLTMRQTSDEPSRVHPVQAWQTPFVSAEQMQSGGEGFLAKVGNADLVRGISELLSLVRLARSVEPTRATFEDVVKGCQRVMDSYYWLSHDEIDLMDLVRNLMATTELVVDEFEKVLVLRTRAEDAVREAKATAIGVIRELRPSDWKEVQPFLQGMAELQKQRGHVLALRDVRYIEQDVLDRLEEQIVEHFDILSAGCVRFLLGGQAWAPIREEIDQVMERAEGATKSTDLNPLEVQAEGLSEGLGLLSEVVATLEVDDPTDRTKLLEEISEVFSNLNRCRASLRQRRKGLLGQEGEAEFAAQFHLLAQSIQSAVSLAETPEACESQQSRLLVQLEDLEGRFSEFDQFLTQLAQKREEIQDAFEAKRQQLLEARQRRAANLVSAAERILQGVERRSKALSDEEALHAYFASDSMILKFNQLSEQLLELGDAVRSEDLKARLKSTKQDALRNLRDRSELFEDGGQLLKFGAHRFYVHDKPFDLTMLPKEDAMLLHVSGTDYWEPVQDEAIVQHRSLWNRQLVSESEDVYRGEYLAHIFLTSVQDGSLAIDTKELLAEVHSEQKLVHRIRDYCSDRYDEGYERGVHDVDAALIAEKLLVLRSSAGALRFSSNARAAAWLWWRFFPEEEQKKQFYRRSQSLGRLQVLFRYPEARGALVKELEQSLLKFFEELEGIHQQLFVGAASAAADYLLEELSRSSPSFTTLQGAEQTRQQFFAHLDRQGQRVEFEEDLRRLQSVPGALYSLVFSWLDAFVQGNPERRRWVPEIAAGIVSNVDRTPSSALTEATVEGLLGAHPRIVGGRLSLRVDAFDERLRRFQSEVPMYLSYRKARQTYLEQTKETMRLSELVPRVLSSFVRNKLIDEVYLPIIGDNLAKQLGAAGASKRTDLMGLLLLVSPPGYGKTTLMEYVAARLGMVFVKVNGPSLGHQVISLDPAEAPNATSRQEVEKINFAFEMANNVMLYLDDIQHVHPEFLQKFISLCDGQRRIEGVWRGRTQTYDLRGKKFCVVMAGNPYTESGDKFQIPDMLANRADTYNLGDVLEGRQSVFALSYLENALTSNPILGPMTSRSLADVHRFIALAQGREVADTDFEVDWSRVEREEAISVLKHLLSAQKVLLRVNQEYIRSASQDDRFRTEPAFKLQGSYRNMNKLAEKIVPAMNEQEVQSLITDHYLGEAQTLTSGAEANLLKLAELRGLLFEVERKRWDGIKQEFRRLQVMGDAGDDGASKVASVLSALGQHLEGIRSELKHTQQQGFSAALAELEVALQKLSSPKLELNMPSSASPDLATLAAPLERLGELLVPVAKAAEHQKSEGARLLPALTELIEVLRIQALAGPVEPAFPLTSS